MNAKVQPIIIIKRKKHAHAGHHGGAWKVAYADFVTAMMALFIVLWLLSSSDQVRKAVGGYFTDPKGSGRDVGNGLCGAGGESLTVNKDQMSKLKDKLALAVKDSPALRKISDQILFTMTSEGLRVEMLEGEKSTFFEMGNAQPTEFGRDLLGKLSEEIGKLPNTVMIEGHTDSKAYGGQDYSNWELSSDRANSARRWMQLHGMRSDQVKQVRGYADESPRTGVTAEDPSNRRITVIIQYQPMTKAEIDEAAGIKEGPSGSEKAETKPAGPEKAKAGPEKRSPAPPAPPKK